MQTKAERYSYWQGIIARYEASGLSQKKFCREHNIMFRRFKYYRYRLKGNKTPPIPSEGFIPVTLSSPLEQSARTSSCFEFVLPNGLKCFVPVDVKTKQLSGLLKELQSCG